MADILLLALSAPKTEPTYLYEDPRDADSAIKLKGFFIEQDGSRIHSMQAPVRDIDRLCATPLIGPRSNKNMATLFTSTDISWQRSLNNSRINDIKTWWNTAGSLSPNGSIIWLPEKDWLNIDTREDGDNQESWITIKPSEWTQSGVCGVRGCTWKPEDIDAAFVDYYYDCCPKCGKCWRPGYLVDGQHRVRGMAQVGSPGGGNLEPVLVSLLSQRDGFSSQKTAKIFTEITSKAEGLHKLHAEFLTAKYKIPKKYSSASPTGINKRKAYEVCVKLNKGASRWSSVTGSSKKGRIKMIAKNKSKIDMIDSIFMSKYVYKGINSDVTTGLGDPPIERKKKPLEGNDVNTIVTYMEFYLNAMLDVWGPGPAGSNDFWNESRGGPAGTGQKKGVFRMMMHLFNIITARIKLSRRVPTKDIYKRELGHIKNIDWEDTNTWAGQYTKQDTEQAVVEKVLLHIYRYAPNPLGTYGANPRIPATINSWMNKKPETFDISVSGRSIGLGEMSIEISSTSTISDPLNAISQGTGGGPLNATGEYNYKLFYGTDPIYSGKGIGKGVKKIEYGKLEIPTGGGKRPVASGDILKIEVEFSNGWALDSRTESKNFTLIA